MKKLLLLLVSVSLLSCSSDDSNDAQQNTRYLNPPSWIQGTWKNEISGFAFKEHDFCTVVSNNETCIDQSLQASANSGASVSSSEHIKSDSEYKFSYTIAGSASAFHFRKVTDTKIEFVNPNNSLPNPTFNKQ